MSQPEHMEKRKVAQIADQLTHTLSDEERRALGKQARRSTLRRQKNYLMNQSQ